MYFLFILNSLKWRQIRLKGVIYGFILRTQQIKMSAEQNVITVHFRLNHQILTAHIYYTHQCTRVLKELEDRTSTFD